MLTPRVLLGAFEGEARLRVARPGFDVTDPALGNEQLAFDSSWPEILSVLAASWQLTGATSVETWTANGVTYTRLYRTVSFAALPWEPICIGWSRSTATGFVEYLQLPSASYTDHCTFTVPSTQDTAFVIFANPLTQADSREADNGGSYTLLAGVHPTRGPGLFVPRRGADVLTCPDTDLRLTIERPPFQIAEAGAVWGTPVNTTPGGSSATWEILATIPLRGSYPDTPPVIVLAGEDRNGAPSIAGPVVRWVDASTIRVRVQTATAQAIQYFIPAYDPAYVHGPDAAAMPRVLMDADRGLAVSKRNVNVLVAPDDDLLFRATRPVLHVAERHGFDNAGTAAAGAQALASTAAGPAIGVFGAYTLGRWWSTWGGINTVAGAFGIPSALPGSINMQLASWIGKDKKLRYAWASGHTTPYLRVAVIDHSALLLDDADLYTGPALQAETGWTDFGGDTIGAAPAGFTVRYVAPSASLQVAAVAGSISGKGAWLNGSPGAASHISWDAAGSAVADFDALMGFTLTGLSTFAPLAIMYRRASVTNFGFAGLLTAAYAGGVPSGQGLWFGSDFGAPVATADYPWAVGTLYWLRVNIRGDQVRMRIWPRGEPEPRIWTLAFVGPAAASGYAGLSIQAATSAQWFVDFFSICTTGRPAWGPV